MGCPSPNTCPKTTKAARPTAWSPIPLQTKGVRCATRLWSAKSSARNDPPERCLPLDLWFLALSFFSFSTILPSMDLRIGTSGWSYPTWKPAFFPDKLPSKRFLEFYSTQLNAVELNGTFRRMPTASAIAGWVGSTTADFRFASKMHQSVTHFKRLRHAYQPLHFFLH